MTLDEAKQLALNVGAVLNYDKQQPEKSYYWSIDVPSRGGFYTARIGDYLVAGKNEFEGYEAMSPARFEEKWAITSIEEEPEQKGSPTRCRYCGFSIERRSSFGEDYWRHIGNRSALCLGREVEPEEEA